MKILILGGYGTFGGRLAQLLASNVQLTLLIAGRSKNKAVEFVRHLESGAQSMAVVFDRNAEIQPQLEAAAPDLVIDATGPFQLYGDDPYRVVKACIALSINYMDFSDASDFVKGISQFDAEAKAANIFMLSGVSSFPILTAAVTRNITRDLVTIKSITGGIAPSPYAKVGLNVIKAITSYAGKPVKLVRDGGISFGYGMIDNCRYVIRPSGVKPLPSIRFSLVDVPDLQVLPELWSDLEQVWMGAGPVPEVLHRMLNAFAWLVRLKILPSLVPFAPLFHRVLSILRWGEHRGGMFVEVQGIDTRGKKVTRSWHLIAEGDDGPFIPAMALVAVINRCLNNRNPPNGARPGTEDLELEDYDRLFNERKITTSNY
jgi:hypothetical protein